MQKSIVLQAKMKKLAFKKINFITIRNLYFSKRTYLDDKLLHFIRKAPQALC